MLNALDNVEARRYVNRLCLSASVPLIEAGSTGYLGQVTSIELIQSEDTKKAPDEERQREVKETSPKTVSSINSKKRNAAMESILEELDDLAHIDDKDAALSPITLWAWLEDSTYINDIKKDDIGDLEVSWQPEIGRGENFWGEMPPVRMGQIGLFDRLQSLLVDENDNEEEDDREEEEKEWIDRIKQKRLKTGTDAALINPMDFMDVSDLSLNERAYIHL